MSPPTIILKSIGPVGTSRPDQPGTITVHGSTVIVQWTDFMLQTPRPATPIR
jgi:hypothetical protein